MGLFVVFLFWLAFVCLLGWMWWKIVEKTGYHGSLGLLLLVPVANIVVMAVLAFKQWPSQKTKTAPAQTSSFSDAVVVILILAGLLPMFGLLAAIAVPNLIRARADANEAFAQHMVQSLATSMETYAATHNGQYPASEQELRQANGFPETYKKEKLGYAYSLDFGAGDYRVTATPEKCGATGTKVFSIQKNGNVTEKECAEVKIAVYEPASMPKK